MAFLPTPLKLFSYSTEILIAIEAYSRIMQFSPECVPCLLNRVLYEVQLVAPDKAEEAMAESLHVLSSEFPKGMNSAKLATIVHERAYAVSGSTDPYADLKRRSDQAAELVFPKAKGLVEEAEDRLEMAVRVAIAGNVLDFGIDVGFDNPEELVKGFDKLVGEGLRINDLDQARKLMRKGGKVLYLLDNCGESVLDRLLIKEIKRLGPRVIGVVKGAPILTDVTMEDAKRAHLDKAFDELLSTESFAVGIDVKKIGPRLRKELEEADLIIAKGMANFESLSDEPFRPVLFLLRGKCEPVSRLIGARRGDNVAKLWS
jgi:damage-control phosphatase, subfamily I